MTNNKARAVLFGVAVGDALGVPVEFESRNVLDREPVTDMLGHGTYDQPLGTWSDDSSLTFCLAESLCKGFDLKDMAEKFVAWKYDAYWTPHGEVFDIGMTTTESIGMLKQILDNGRKNDLRLMPEWGSESRNGNGGLMRILPLYFYLHGRAVEEQFEVIRMVTALTHGHIRATLANVIYLIMADEIVNGKDLRDAYTHTRNRALKSFDKWQISPEEKEHFNRVLQADISAVQRKEIETSPYVVYSLEASLWCVLNSSSYGEAVLKAVNLGGDTDTNAAIAGGLAGLYYGEQAIPKSWQKALVKRGAIEELADALDAKYPLETGNRK